MRDTAVKPDQVFVVRAWKEHLSGDPCTSDWRGRVSHLNTKSESHFVGVAALKRIFQQILGHQEHRPTKRQLEISEEQL